MSKSKKAKTAPPASRPGKRSVRSLFVVFATVLAIVGLLYGLSRLGDEARLHLGARERYAFRFVDIECPTPPGLDRTQFLGEVRKASGFPETFQLLEPNVLDHLRAAFAAHPWVEAVDGPSIKPPSTVQVGLKFRTPARAVTFASEPPAKRLFDSNGVLLPETGIAKDVAELANVVPPPVAGKPAADETVQRALELVKLYHPRRLEKTAKDWRLTQADGKVLVVGW